MHYNRAVLVRTPLDTFSRFSPAHDKVQGKHEAQMHEDKDGPGKMSAQADPVRRHPLVFLPHTAWCCPPFAIMASLLLVRLLCTEGAPDFDVTLGELACQMEALHKTISPGQLPLASSFIAAPTQCDELT